MMLKKWASLVLVVSGNGFPLSGLSFSF